MEYQNNSELQELARSIKLANTECSVTPGMVGRALEILTNTLDNQTDPTEAYKMAESAGLEAINASHAAGSAERKAESAVDIAKKARVDLGYFPTETYLMEKLSDPEVFADQSLMFASFTVGGRASAPRYAGLLIQVFDRNVGGNSGTSRVGQYLISDGMKIWYRTIYDFKSVSPNIGSWTINELNSVHFFSRYDVVHSSQSSAEAGDRGRISLDTEHIFPGYVTYLERDGVFVVQNYLNTWNTRWGAGDAFGTLTSKGVVPKASTVYVCTDTGQQYTVVNGKLTPADPRPERLRVLSWNIGCFSKGNSSSSMMINEEAYRKNLVEFAKMFNNVGADLIGLCEYRNTILSGFNVRADLLGGYSFAGLSSSFDEYVGKGVFAAAPLRNITEISLPQGKTALECEMLLGGKTFVVCMAHLPWALGSSGADHNMQAIGQLCDRYRYVPRVLLMGDFNARHDNEAARWQAFRDAGFKMANHGSIGSFLTSYGNKECTNAPDNIMVKGATIVRVGTVQFTPEDCDPYDPKTDDDAKWDAVNLSDHFPLFADIIF